MNEIFNLEKEIRKTNLRKVLKESLHKCYYINLSLSRDFKGNQKIINEFLSFIVKYDGIKNIYNENSRRYHLPNNATVHDAYGFLAQQTCFLAQYLDSIGVRQQIRIEAFDHRSMQNIPQNCIDMAIYSFEYPNDLKEKVIVANS